MLPPRGGVRGRMAPRPADAMRPGRHRSDGLAPGWRIAAAWAVLGLLGTALALSSDVSVPRAITDAMSVVSEPRDQPTDSPSAGAAMAPLGARQEPPLPGLAEPVRALPFSVVVDIGATGGAAAGRTDMFITTSALEEGRVVKARLVTQGTPPATMSLMTAAGHVHPSEAPYRATQTVTLRMPTTATLGVAVHGLPSAGSYALSIEEEDLVRRMERLPFDSVQDVKPAETGRHTWHLFQTAREVRGHSRITASLAPEPSLSARLYLLDDHGNILAEARANGQPAAASAETLSPQRISVVVEAERGAGRYDLRVTGQMEPDRGSPGVQ